MATIDQIAEAEIRRNISVSEKLLSDYPEACGERAKIVAHVNRMKGLVNFSGNDAK